MPHDIWHAHSDWDWYESVGAHDEPPAGADEIDIRLERRYRELAAAYRVLAEAPESDKAAAVVTIGRLQIEIDDLEEELGFACARDDRRDYWSRVI